MRFLLEIFIAVVVLYTNFLWASQKEVCNGNLCVDFKNALKVQDFELADSLYKELLEGFEKENLIGYAQWSTMVDLTKSYVQFCVKQGNVKQAFIVIDRLLQKSPPELLCDHLFVLKECLNPNGLSLGNFLRGLENIQNGNKNLFLDPQDLLFFNAYKYFVVDYFETLRQKANKALFMGNYNQAIDLYAQISLGIQQGDFPLSKQDKVLALSELEMLTYQAILKQSETLSKPEDQIIPFVNYFQSRMKHEKLLVSIVSSLKNNENGKCSSDLSRNLLDLANFYYANQYKERSKELLEFLVKKSADSARTRKLGLLKLLAITLEEEKLEELGSLLCLGKRFFKEDESEYFEFCLYQGIFFYYQGKLDEASKHIKLAIKNSDDLGMKMPLALQYLGYSLIDCANTLVGEKREIILQEAYDVFLSLLNNWDRIEGLLGCFYIKAQQVVISDWEEGLELVRNNLSKLSIIQKQLLFNLNLVSQRVSEFYIEKDIQTNNFYLLWAIVSNDAYFRIEDFYYNGTNLVFTLEKIIVSLLKNEKRKNLDGIEGCIQHFLHKNILNLLERRLNQLTTSSKREFAIIWCISLIKDFYEKGFQFSEISLEKYRTNCSKEQQDILFCIEALVLLSTQSKDRVISFLEEKITISSSLPQEFLKLLFLEHASEKDLDKKRSTIMNSIRSGYFSEEIFFKMFPLESYVLGQNEAIHHLYRFISLFPNSQLIPIVFYFLGINQKDSVKAIYYFTTAIEDYADINPNGFNQYPFTYFFYKIKLELCLSLIKQGTTDSLKKAVETLEKMKADFSCLNHPLITFFKEKYSTLKIEVDIDYLLTYCLLQLDLRDKLELHLINVLKSYTPYFNNHELNRLLCFLWSLQKALVGDLEENDTYNACQSIIYFIRPNEHDYKQKRDIKKILPLDLL